MAGPDRKIEIGISTTADLAAAKDSAEAIHNVGAAANSSAKQLGGFNDSAEALARQFAESNAKSVEWGQTLEKLSNDQLLQVEERLRAQIKAQQELGENTDELKRKLTDVYNQRTGELDATLSKTANNARDAAHAGGELAGKLHEVRGAAKGTHEVLEGLERGGIGGLIKAGRGLGEILHSLAGSALRGAFIPAALAAGAAVLALRKHGEKLEEENKKTLEEATKRSERMKLAYEEIAKSAEKTAEAQIKAVEKVIASYDEFLGRLDRTDARLKESIKLQGEAKSAGLDRDEQRALDKAKTPEEREKITKSFEERRTTLKNNTANAEIIDTASNARLRLDENAVKTSEFQAQRDAAQRNLEEKKKAEEKAVADSRDISNTLRREGKNIAASPEANAARDIALKAQRERIEAEKQNAEVLQKFKTGSDKIEEENAQASSQLGNARTRGERRIAELEADTAKRQNESKPERERLKKEATAALDSGNSDAQDRAAKQLRDLEKTVANATAENTRAIRELTAALGAQRGLGSPAPNTEPVSSRPGGALIKTSDGEVVSGGGTIQRSGSEAIAVKTGDLISKPSREATVTVDGVQKSLDSALKESRAKDVAFVTFANTVADDSKSTRKQVEKTERQIANSTR
jgi:hypothetical protein